MKKQKTKQTNKQTNKQTSKQTNKPKKPNKQKTKNKQTKQNKQTKTKRIWYELVRKDKQGFPNKLYRKSCWKDLWIFGNRNDKTTRNKI